MDKFEKRELEIWGLLSGGHPNILELYGAVKSHSKVTIFMEFMNGKAAANLKANLSWFFLYGLFCLALGLFMHT